MTAIILAAGFSKRFGGKKLLIEIDQKPMILHVVDMVLTMGFEEVILVYQDEEVRKVIGNRNVKYIFNERSMDGLSTSVRCGVKQAKESTDGFMFFVGDQPFIDRQTVKTLLDAFENGKGSIIVPMYAGRKGNPVIFSSSWRDKLQNITGDIGGREIIEKNSDQVYSIAISDLKAGMDIDTREQYNSVENIRGNTNNL